MTATWTPCDGFDSNYRNSHHSPEFYSAEQMPVKTVLTFQPGCEPAAEQMPAGTPGMEESWIYYRIGHYLLWDRIAPDIMAYRPDSSRARESVVLPSGEVVSGTLVLVGMQPDGQRRSLTDEEISTWRTGIVPVPPDRERHGWESRAHEPERRQEDMVTA